MVRCLPPDTAFKDFYTTEPEAAFIAYSDGVCTVPIAIGNPTSAASPAPAFARDLQRPVGSCSAKVCSVGASLPLPITIYGRTSDGAYWGAPWQCSACSDITYFIARYSPPAYGVTGEVAPATFAPMTEEVR